MESESDEMMSMDGRSERIIANGGPASNQSINSMMGG